MKISAGIAVWMCTAFALVCFGFALSGFSALSSIADVAERELSVGYAWFWTFLGVVAVTFGILSWMIKEGKLGAPEQM
jgi:uncharacterized membrane protein YidH (DUF202 family)